MNQTIQAIIVDDHSIFRKGIKMTLERIPNIKVIAEANNGLEFLQLLNMQTPDVVLMDYLMPEMDGIEAASQALQKNPQLKIISMTMMNNEFYLTRMLKAGIKGIIPKNTSKFELTEAIHKVVVGEDYISKTYNMHLIHNHLKSKTMTTTKKV